MPDLEAQAAALRKLVEKAPQAALERKQIPIQGTTIGYPSAVAMSDAGEISVLQRGDSADPLLVLNSDGKVLRSWGKGLYKIPHSVRVDRDGNIWTVDSGSSMVLKFSPKGDKLMEISVGEQPAGRGATNGTSDIAFGPNGRIFIADGYGNSRILEYNAKGDRVKQWGAREPVADNSTSRTASQSTIAGSFTSRTGTMPDCSVSTWTGTISVSGITSAKLQQWHSAMAPCGSAASSVTSRMRQTAGISGSTGRPAKFWNSRFRGAVIMS